MLNVVPKPNTCIARHYSIIIIIIIIIIIEIVRTKYKLLGISVIDNEKCKWMMKEQQSILPTHFQQHWPVNWYEPNTAL
jgi:hypothetical protein